MSRHEGVSCDSCLKGNFRGRRFKCLICYDYDLCAACYESGATTTNHASEHPMQCILTRSDFDLYYAGEALSAEQPQAFTCPFCGKMGHTEASLQEHVTSDHAETTQEVICPICASLPGGDPNLVTDDFGGHLTLEHRNGPRDLISFLDEPASSRHGVRRIPHPSRGVAGPRPRRSNMHFSSSGALSPLSRDSVDPIAELLTQLSGVRRSAGQGSSQTLQQLQMQLQLERQQVRAARQQVERLPRRQTQSSAAPASSSTTAPVAVPVQDTPTQSQPASQSQFLLSRIMEESVCEYDLEKLEHARADRGLFVQELFLSTLAGVEKGLHKTTQTVTMSTNSSTSTNTTTTTTSIDQQNNLTKFVSRTVNNNTSTSTNHSSVSKEEDVQARSSGVEQTNEQYEQEVLMSQQQQQHTQSSSCSSSTSTSSKTSTNASKQAFVNKRGGGSGSSNRSLNLSSATTAHPGARTQQPSLSCQGSGGSVRGILAPQQQTQQQQQQQQQLAQQQAPPTVRHAPGPGVGMPIGRANVRKPVRSVEGRNQASEPPPPH